MKIVGWFRSLRGRKIAKRGGNNEQSPYNKKNNKPKRKNLERAQESRYQTKKNLARPIDRVHTISRASKIVDRFEIIAEVRRLFGNARIDGLHLQRDGVEALQSDVQALRSDVQQIVDDRLEFLF